MYSSSSSNGNTPAKPVNLGFEYFKYEKKATAEIAMCDAEIKAHLEKYKALRTLTDKTKANNVFAELTKAKARKQSIETELTRVRDNQKLVEEAKRKSTVGDILTLQSAALTQATKKTSESKKAEAAQAKIDRYKEDQQMKNRDEKLDREAQKQMDSMLEEQDGGLSLEEQQMLLDKELEDESMMELEVSMLGNIVKSPQDVVAERIAAQLSVLNMSKHKQKIPVSVQATNVDQDDE